ncbi:MAG TPA: MipA/OmpV family protein [Sphingomicrobium sp.]|nr:MipA/OmpV family protein [Sphingomicrobium sp.]
MRRYACLALATCCLSVPAIAQDQPAAGQLPSPEEIANRDTVTVGVGAAITPDYEGSDDYRVIPAAAIRGQVSGISFSTRGTYLYVDVLSLGSDKIEFNAGPIVGLRLTTRRHIKDDVVELLPRRKRAFEVGGFAGASVHGLTNPYDTLGFRVDVTHDIGNAHESTIFSPNIEFSTPLSQTTYVSASAGMEFVANRFADYYFTITPSDRLATGNQLPVFDADGGLKNWKLGLLLNQSVTGDLLHGFSVFGLGQYSRLVGDFKRSPIVSLRGSAGQWLGAVGVAYTW